MAALVYFPEMVVLNKSRGLSIKWFVKAAALRGF